MGMQNKEFGKISKFTDLIAWQEGHRLVLLTYEAIGLLPDSERFGLADQMRRAVVSVTSNIAEGFAKKSSKDKNRFYNMSQTSLIELQNQLLICKDLSYVDNNVFKNLAEQSVVCHKLINGLMRSTRLKKYE